MNEEELFNQIYTAISRAEALASVMGIAAEGARSLFSGHAATIYFLDEKEQLLVPQNGGLPEGLTSKIEKLLGSKVRGLRFPVIGRKMGSGLAIQQPDIFRQSLVLDCKT